MVWFETSLDQNIYGEAMGYLEASLISPLFSLEIRSPDVRFGQKQTCAAHKPMSAECQKRTFPHIRLTQLGTSSVDAIGNSISKMEP